MDNNKLVSIEDVAKSALDLDGGFMGKIRMMSSLLGLIRQGFAFLDGLRNDEEARAAVRDQVLAQNADGTTGVWKSNTPDGETDYFISGATLNIYLHRAETTLNSDGPLMTLIPRLRDAFARSADRRAEKTRMTPLSTLPEAVRLTTDMARKLAL